MNLKRNQVRSEKMYSTLCCLLTGIFVFLSHLLLTVFQCATSQLQIHLSQNKPPLHPSMSAAVPASPTTAAGIGGAVSLSRCTTSSQEILSNSCPHQVALKGMGVLQNSLLRLLRMKSPTHRFTHLLMLNHCFAKNQSAYNQHRQLKGLSAVWKLRFAETTTTHIPHSN